MEVSRIGIRKKKKKAFKNKGEILQAEAENGPSFFYMGAVVSGMEVRGQNNRQ